MSYNVTELQLQSSLENINTISNYRVFPLLLETALLAIYTIQTAFLVYQRWVLYLDEKPKAPAYIRGRPKPYVNRMLALTTSLYILAVTYWALDVSILQSELLVFMPNQLSIAPSPQVYQSFFVARGVKMYVQAVIQILIWIASDCIALWRAYVVLGRPRWLKFTVVMIVLVEFGVYAEYIVFAFYILYDPPRFIEDLWTSSSGLIGTAPFAATSATTAVVQMFTASAIAYQAQIIFKSRRSLFQGPGQNLRTLSVFVESGVAYTALWVWYAIGADHNITNAMVAKWTNYYVVPLTAMYPTLVVMFVTMQDSVLADNLPLSSKASDFQIRFNTRAFDDAEHGIELGYGSAAMPQLERMGTGPISEEDKKMQGGEICSVEVLEVIV